METVGYDDPYGDLVKFCRITSSQDQKLQACPFARADETFPAAFDSLGSSFSQAMTQSPPPVITMVSLSDSDEEDEEPPNDDNAPVENDEYQTPPEEHNTSYCSSQEEIQLNPQLAPVVGEKIEAVIGNDGDSAPGLEIIGFPEQLEATRDGELNEFGVSGENSGEPPWKKIRVSGVNWESPMLNTVQEEEVIASQQASDYADGADVDVDGGELIDMVIESDEKIGSDGAGSDEEIGLDGAGRDEEIGLDVAGSDEEIGPDGAGMDEEIGLDGAGNDDGEGMSNCVKNGGEKSVASDGDLVVEEVGGSKKSVSSDGDLAVEEVGGSKKSVSGDGDLAVEEVGNGKKSVSGDGDLVEEVKNDSGVKSASMDRGHICAFKYATGCGGGDNGDQQLVRKKRELPASMREKCSDRERQKGDKVGDNGNVEAKVLSWKELSDTLAKIGKNKKRELPALMREKCSDRERQKQKGDKVGDNGNVEAKVLSWKELFDRLAKIMKYKEVDRDAEEEYPDFLETAKRRGMTFPTPRWKSP